MKIVFLEQAVADLVWFKRYYQEVFQSGAIGAARHYRRSMDLLAVHPMAGREVEGGVREWPIRRTPFCVIYRLKSERIEVLRIWDKRADNSDAFPEDEA
ncbi:type II toxin-antitoxin system RelE/ParE family toxin [Jiella marina]|uniref:type II toxin-antitoxin system RelE/ParE family toxin n=1 Tax=Jiella sp. LLJ827 TaxID=2917712 RepID=UPI002100E959|nr:type II toxin-antitoxin system RelE/ParE family toxin [Jiella sp. LLJ827]MCQ0988522.1 type II toxin-antitoxin system RelE/ParE family toxin [Jiella sp. LLJ827]